MYKLAYKDEAIKEYEESVLWYGERSTEVAEKFVLEVELKIEDIRSNPQQYKKRYKRYYETILKKYPFTIIYTIKDDTILILSIYHQSRNPKHKYRKF